MHKLVMRIWHARIYQNAIIVVLACCEFGQAVRRYAAYRRNNGAEEHGQKDQRAHAGGEPGAALNGAWAA